MVRNLTGLFVVVVLAIAGFAWYHAESIKSIKAQPLSLFHWEDTTSRATIRQVMRVGDFKPVRHRRQNLGYTESIHWFRFRLTAHSLPSELTLDTRDHTINYADFIAVQNGKLVSITRTGDWLPFAQRPIPTRTFAFPIYLDPHQTTDFYLRLNKRYEHLATEITLWRTSDFDDKEQREFFLWGIFVGVVVLVVLLNLIFWATTSDRVYLWYAIYILGLTLRQSADSGLGFQYLWPTTPVLNVPHPLIQSLWLYLPAVLQFQQYFMNLRQGNRWLFGITQVMKYLSWTGFLILLVLQISGIVWAYPEMGQVVTQIHAVLANVVVFTCIWVAIVGLRSGNELKQVYGAGLALQMAGQIVNIIQYLMRYQTDVYFVNPYVILTFIFFIDLVIFAYLLAYRYRQSITENQRLTISLARTQQETNQKIIDMLDAERQQIHTLLLSDVGQRLQEARRILTTVPPSPILTDSVRLIQKVDADLGQISQNSLPVAVVEKGLSASLSERVQELNQAQPVRFTFTQTGAEPALSVAQEVQLYRIGNELINNVIKHAQATEAAVTLATGAAGISLTISDNGKGFNPATVTETAGIGMRNLQARARELQATLTMNSGDNGTTITVVIPQKIQTS